MSETLSFEEKIQGLNEYWQTLWNIDPSNPDHGQPRDGIFYYAGGMAVGHALETARQCVVYDIGCHARVEYRRRGFETKNLHDDTNDELWYRAGILATMTAPLSDKEMGKRADRIMGLLDRVLAGERIEVAEFADSDSVHRYDAQDVFVDRSRKLFIVFRSHVSGRTAFFKYDRPDFHHTEETVLKIGLPEMFKDGGIILEPSKPS